MLDIRMPDLLRSNAVRSFILLAMLLSAFGSSAGRAQETIDVAKITCDQFLSGQPFDSTTVSIWLGGYYHGERHDTVANLNAYKKGSLDMMDYCVLHNDMSLMEAFQNVLGAKK
jgi:hypothetical protein